MPSFNHPHILLAPDINTFPTPISTPDSKQVRSIVPRAVTDMSSQDGEESHQEATPTALRSMAASKTDRPGLDPVRPPSAMSFQTYQSARSPPSRGGGPFSGGWRAGGAFGGSGIRSNASRPPSATSRTSRTHAPSLASHAFFRPMSSQRLQAQRRARPSHVSPPVQNLDGFSETGSNANVQSVGSNATGQPELSIYHHIDLPTPSRGTEFTEPDERDTVNASPTGNATVQSMGESERPLHTGSSNRRSKYQNPEDSKPNSGVSPPMQKPPMTFSANFLVSTKRDMLGLREGRGLGHVSLSNTPATSALSGKPSKPGINYQYFSGNTIFCWRGRLQNARDYPVNIATGILVVLPAALFFTYSYGASYTLFISNRHADQRQRTMALASCIASDSDHFRVYFRYLYIIFHSCIRHRPRGKCLWPAIVSVDLM